MNHKEKGFTLIETIIYLALFIVIIGGTILVSYNMIQTSTESTERAQVYEEANFILAKIDHGLTGAISISVPDPHTLNITKASGTESFTLSGTDLTLNGTILNSGSVRVDPLSFVFTPSSTAADSLQTSLSVTDTLTSKYQDLSTIKYLR